MQFLKKSRFAMAVVVAMVVEAVVIVLFLPGRSQNVHAEGQAEATQAQPELQEVELGEFKVNNASNPDVMVRIDFRVVATIAPTEEMAASSSGGKDGQNVPPNLAKKRYRIREAIQTVMRKASYDSLKEPSLATIKRQIKAEVLEVLGGEKPTIEGIVIPEFKLTET